RGFLREYARYVGLSPDEVVNHWLAVQQSGERHEEVAASSSRGPGRRLPVLYLFLAVLLVLVLAGLGFYWQRHAKLARPGHEAEPAAPTAPAAGAEIQSSPGPPTGAPAKPAAAPVSSPPAAAPPELPEAPPAPLEVNLDFSRECWVDALIDGKKRITEQRVAGEALRLPAQQKVLLTLGDAGAAEVQVNGTPLSLPVTGDGKVLHDFTIDLDTLKTLKARKETH
ncbi:MAG TPA: RodZ domain-containing protein, partial [Thermoanaerobaculia bacterium]|nr:RodZ domain-containing protein [Thermoanaerobaculia bacterium]